MQGSLTTRSNIYRAISALFFTSFKFRVSPEGLKTKKMRKGVRNGRCAIPMDVFSGEYPTGLRFWDRINMFSVQIILSTQPSLGNQICYSIPSDQLLTSGERGC